MMRLQALTTFARLRLSSAKDYDLGEIFPRRVRLTRQSAVV